jgi:hypothetical protein
VIGHDSRTSPLSSPLQPGSGFPLSWILLKQKSARRDEGLFGQRRPGSVSGRGSVSDQRKATCVGGSRDGRARSARGGQGGLSVPKPPGVRLRGPRPAERSRPRLTLSASRTPHPNTLTPSLTRPATRSPQKLMGNPSPPGEGKRVMPLFGQTLKRRRCWATSPRDGFTSDRVPSTLPSPGGRERSIRPL